MTLIGKLNLGKTSKRLKEATEQEKIEPEILAEKILKGRAVLPCNLRRKGIKAIAVGEGLSTKVNANIGTSEDYPYLKDELKKLEVAIGAGADTVMDLSTGGNLDQIRREIIANSSIPVGTVPIYQAVLEAKEKYGSIVELSANYLFEVIEKQAEDEVDFMTVHCGVTQKALQALQEQGRITEIVSRGGAFIAAWMLRHQKENPLYDNFDRLLRIAKKFDVTLSLGDGMRPGCLADASDRAQFTELLTLGELVREARKEGVQVMVEGPGHLPFDQIIANVQMEKEICEGAPFYLLGPLVTDIAPGYDHITSAIGGTMAAYAGADFLCYVTPREHLGLPTIEDVKEGVIVSRIAAHAADIAKGVKGAADWDLEMAQARKALDWHNQIRLSINPEKAKKAYQERKGEEQEACTMCGEFCAMKLVSQFFGSQHQEKCL